MLESIPFGYPRHGASGIPDLEYARLAEGERVAAHARREAQLEHCVARPWARDGRVELVLGHVERLRGVPVDQDLHAALAAQHDVHVPRVEVEAQPRVLTCERVLREQGPAAGVLEPVLRQRGRELVACLLADERLRADVAARVE